MIGHNSGDTLDGTAAKLLREYVSRLENLEEDKAAISADIKEVYAEAKSNGLDSKIIRKVISIRKKDQTKLDEEQTLLELYLSVFY